MEEEDKDKLTFTDYNKFIEYEKDFINIKTINLNFG
jgi:hypothetical protein